MYRVPWILSPSLHVVDFIMSQNKEICQSYHWRYAVWVTVLAFAERGGGGKQAGVEVHHRPRDWGAWPIPSHPDIQVCPPYNRIQQCVRVLIDNSFIYAIVTALIAGCHTITWYDLYDFISANRLTLEAIWRVIYVAQRSIAFLKCDHIIRARSARNNRNYNDLRVWKWKLYEIKHRTVVPSRIGPQGRESTT